MSPPLTKAKSSIWLSIQFQLDEAGSIPALATRFSTPHHKMRKYGSWGISTIHRFYDKRVSSSTFMLGGGEFIFRRWKTLLIQTRQPNKPTSV